MPATYALKVNGEATAIRPGWSLSATANGRDVLTCAIASRDGSNRPPLDGDVVFTEGVDVLTSSVAAATVIVTREAHGFVSGQDVEITGHSGSTPDLNGLHTATVISPTSFSIPVTVSTGGTGGLASRRLIAGTIQRPVEMGWDGQGHAPIVTGIEVADRNAIAERRYISAVLTGASPAVPAYGFLEIASVFPNGAEVALGSRTYTFVTTLSNVDGYVLIGATLNACLRNLLAAVVAGDGSGTLYAAATTVNADVQGVVQANVLKAVARVPGTAGNSLPFTTTHGSCYGEGGVAISTLQNGAASSGTANTVGSVAAALAVLLADDGVTIHPDQEDITTLPELPYDYMLLRDVLDQISALSNGAVWSFDAYFRLRFILPASDPAPVNVTASNSVAIGDIEVDRARSSTYANRVTLRYSNVAQTAYAFLEVTANFTDGKQVVMGSQTYTFDAVLEDTAGHVLLGATILESLQNLIAAVMLGSGSGTIYSAKTAVNASAGAYLHTSAILKAVALTAGAAGNSVAVSTDWEDAVWYGEGSVPLASLARGADQELANTVTVNSTSEQRTHGVWQAVIESLETTGLEQATTIANTYLAASILVPRVVTYVTAALGLRPGQSQSIVAATRDLNGTFLITDVETSRTTGSRVLRTITAIESLVLQSVERWQETYKRVFGVSGSGTAVSYVGGGGSTVIVRGTIYAFGGSETVWQQTAAGAWIAANSIQIQIDTAVRGSLIGTCYVRLRAASGTVTARLRNVTDGATVGTSTAVSSTTLETVSFPVLLTAGVRIYAIEISPSAADTDIQMGCGYME